MMKVCPTYAVAVFASAWLIACSEAPREPMDAPANPPAVEVAGFGPATGTNGMITADPGAVACQESSIVGISWNAAKAVEQDPTVAGVQVWIGEGADAKLFAEGGLQGSQETGAWVRADTVFRLVAIQTGKELDRLVTGGGPCIEPAAADPGQ